MNKLLALGSAKALLLVLLAVLGMTVATCGIIDNQSTVATADATDDTAA